MTQEHSIKSLSIRCTLLLDYYTNVILIIFVKSVPYAFFQKPRTNWVALWFIIDPFPHVYNKGLGSNATTFHVDTIREIIGDDAIT